MRRVDAQRYSQKSLAHDRTNQGAPIGKVRAAEARFLPAPQWSLSQSRNDLRLEEKRMMNWVVRVARRNAMLRFKLLRLATIKDIPTERFNQIIETLRQSGWRKTSEYDGFDAWIDYGRINMQKGKLRLKLEWNNWTEGSIEGNRAVVEGIAKNEGLPVSYDWRWTQI